MSNNRSGAGAGGSRPNRRPGGSSSARTRGNSTRTRRPTAKPGFKIVEKRESTQATEKVQEAIVPAELPFRILIAVHRPRFRGRAERAARLVGWEITTLLNKQDVVGQVAKLPRPPDLVVLSGDFGRQRDYAIFRAIQAWRKQGMTLIGMVEDCQTAPEGFPDSSPDRLCDICLTPPYRAADLRTLYVRLYEEIRGEPAPPPWSAIADQEDEADES